MIYYLAHPYTGQEQASFEQACRWTRALRHMGHTVFSPIMHTHPYSEYLYYDKPLGDDPQTYLKTEDWVGWDLDLLYGFRKGRLCICPECPACLTGLKQINTYDTGVTVLLSRTAFDQPPNYDWRPDLEIDPHNWASDGCRREYEFAKAHHIRVLQLEAFLEGREVDL